MGGLCEAEIAVKGSNEPGFARRIAMAVVPTRAMDAWQDARYGTSFSSVAY